MTVAIEKKLDCTPEGIADALLAMSVEDMVKLQRILAERGVSLQMGTGDVVQISPMMDY